MTSKLIVVLRIFACGSVRQWKLIADTIKAQFPQYPVVDASDLAEGGEWAVDTSVLKSLGHERFIPFEQTLKDTVDSLIQLGLVDRK